MVSNVVNASIAINDSLTSVMVNSCMAIREKLQRLDEAYPIYKANPGWMNVDFVIFAVVFSVLSVIGLAGNAILFSVLRKTNSFGVVAPYFICMAICDSIFIVTNHFGFCIQYGLKHMVDMKFICGTYEQYFEVYVQPLLRASFIATALLMATLAITRTISIFKPLMTKQWLSPKITWRLSLTLTLTPFLFNLLPFCGNYVGDCTDVNETYTWSVVVKGDAVTELLIYVLFSKPAQIIMFLTWTAVVMTNFILIWKIRNMKKARKQLTTTSKMDKTNRATILLLCVTMTFCLLLLPSFTKIIVNAYTQNRGSEGICQYPSAVAAQRVNYSFRLLFTVNSSVNLYWFLTFGTGFRAEVANALFFWRKINRN